MSDTIIQYVFLGIILAVSIGLHEYAHAITSYRLGDPTPKLQGRLTPNPLAHLDPLGFLLIFVIHFGRGKPVEINPRYYRHPARDELLVALAGPATNVILGVVGILITLLYAKFGLQLNFATDIFGGDDIFVRFWMLFSSINLGMAVFNMIPLPPLDGFRIVKLFAYDFASQLQHIVGRAPMIFTLLMVTVFARPIGDFVSGVSSRLFEKIFWIISLILL